MSLITSCPSCGTKFRVVTDQLRISEGWVRCGRCQEVFDATQALQDAPAPSAKASAAAESAVQGDIAAKPVSDAAQLPDNAPALQAPLAIDQPVQAAPIPAITATTAANTKHDVGGVGYELPVPPDDEADEHAVWVNSMLQLPIEASQAPPQAAFTKPAVAPSKPTLPWAPEQSLAAEDAQALQWSDAWLAQPPLGQPVVPPLDEAQRVLPTDDGAAPELDAPETQSPELDDAQPEPTPVPSFVKQAQRKAWWNKPGVRFVMGMLVILLPVALVLQIAVHERNSLVAWKPQWRAALQSMCVALRCEIGLRKHIASVVLTGSSFYQDGQAHHYRLGLSMQNRSAAAVATPALELTLSDAQGQMVVRKVLQQADLGAPLELAPHSEWNGSLPVVIEGLQLGVSGYSMLAFCP